jgi:Holliday junction resolvasome RuvABC endonuclease subunit
MKLWLGVDVGINGGIAFIPEKGNSWAIKMPDTLCDLWDAIDNIGFDFTYLHACLERVHSSPQMGVKSAFTFGQGFGHLEMALTAAKIPFTYVTPQKWQKELGCLTGGDKNVSKGRAQQLFPHIKCTHAISDALLIAEYCRRTIR